MLSGPHPEGFGTHTTCMHTTSARDDSQTQDERTVSAGARAERHPLSTLAPHTTPDWFSALPSMGNAASHASPATSADDGAALDFDNMRIGNEPNVCDLGEQALRIAAEATEARIASGFDDRGRPGGTYSAGSPPPGMAFGGYLKNAIGVTWIAADSQPPSQPRVPSEYDAAGRPRAMHR